jgi:hypothetical protein
MIVTERPDQTLLSSSGPTGRFGNARAFDCIAYASDYRIPVGVRHRARHWRDPVRGGDERNGQDEQGNDRELK